MRLHGDTTRASMVSKCRLPCSAEAGNRSDRRALSLLMKSGLRLCSLRCVIYIYIYIYIYVLCYVMLCYMYYILLLILLSRAAAQGCAQPLVLPSWRSPLQSSIWYLAFTASVLAGEFRDGGMEGGMEGGREGGVDGDPRLLPAMISDKDDAGGGM